MPDLIIVGLILIGVIAVIYKAHKDRKSGKSSFGCGCGCSSCSACDHTHKANEY